MHDDRGICARRVAAGLLATVILACAPAHLHAAQAEDPPLATDDTSGPPERLLPLFERLRDLPKEEAFEKLIRRAYADLERWTEPSSKDLFFELVGFVHIPKKAFDSVTSTDVVSLPGGDTVVAARVHNRAPWTDDVRVMYDLSWTTPNEHLLQRFAECAFVCG